MQCEDFWQRLRGWLYEPSQEHWVALCHCFVEWSREPETYVAELMYASRHLASWPSGLIDFSNMPRPPLERWLVDDVHLPLLSLMRSVSRGGHLWCNTDLERLYREPWFRTIEVLDLSEYPLDDESFQLLLDTPFERLQSLNLSSTGIRTNQFRALINQKAMSDLRELYISDNPIDYRGSNALANHSRLYALEKLDISRSGMGQRGLESLFQSRHLPRLRELHCGGLSLDCPQKAKRFRNRLSQLQVLNISHSEIDALALPWLCCLLEGCGSLTRLELQGNQLGDEGIHLFAASELFGRLTYLDLRGNHSWFRADQRWELIAAFEKLEERAFRYRYPESEVLLL